MVVVLNEITKTAVVSNGVRERNAAMESELKKSALAALVQSSYLFTPSKKKYYEIFLLETKKVLMKTVA